MIDLIMKTSRDEGNREGDEEGNVELVGDLEREVEDKLIAVKERDEGSEKEEQAEDAETKAIEASEYIDDRFKGKTLKSKFELIRREWSYPAINAKHVKTTLASFIFYKFLFLFATRFE